MMMAHKQLLHELLKEDQEPFQLQRYIADRRSQLTKKPSPLPLRKGKPIAAATKRVNLSRHACFFSFQNSPDVRKSPFRDLPLSPAKSPCKSPHRAAFLHIPTKTAAHLAEAAMRIQKQRQSKPKTQPLGFGLFGSFLKTLKDRSTNNRKRAIGSSDFNATAESGAEAKLKAEETVRISSSRSKRRLSSADWTENNEDKSLDFEASTSGYGSDCSEDVTSDFGFPETRFCSSPFSFSFHKSPLSNSRRKPDFCSPAASPCRPSNNKEEESIESQNSDEVLLGQEEEEEKEQCSPVSVLDPPFEDYDGPERGDAEMEDYDLECSYVNVQRAKEQLLYRLRRFEKLAELDPMELEKKLLEESDSDDSGDQEECEDDEPLSLNRQATADIYQCSLHCPSMTDLTKLVSDEKHELICPGGREVAVVARIGCTWSDSWKEVGLNTISAMTGLDLKEECEGWIKLDEQVEETAAEIEHAVFGLLVEELSKELVSYYYMDRNLMTHFLSSVIA